MNGSDGGGVVILMESFDEDRMFLVSWQVEVGWTGAEGQRKNYRVRETHARNCIVTLNPHDWYW